MTPFDPFSIQSKGWYDAWLHVALVIEYRVFEAVRRTVHHSETHAGSFVMTQGAFFLISWHDGNRCVSSECIQGSARCWVATSDTHTFSSTMLAVYTLRWPTSDL